MNEVPTTNPQYAYIIFAAPIFLSGNNNFRLTLATVGYMDRLMGPVGCITQYGCLLERMSWDCVSILLEYSSAVRNCVVHIVRVEPHKRLALADLVDFVAYVKGLFAFALHGTLSLISPSFF
jgi:hypothetical protein